MSNEACIFNDAEMKTELHRAIINNAGTNERIAMTMEHMKDNIVKQNDELAMHGGSIDRLAKSVEKGHNNNKTLIRVVVGTTSIAFIAVGGGAVLQLFIQLVVKIKDLI